MALYTPKTCCGPAAGEARSGPAPSQQGSPQGYPRPRPSPSDGEVGSRHNGRFAMRLNGRIARIAPLGLVVLTVAAPAAFGQKKKKAKPDYHVTIHDDEFLRGKNVIIRQPVADMEVL